jgi:vacuolar-type H+-ATPase subunit I/STV1
MNKDYPGEQWKTVKFDKAYTNEGRIEVSNFGRIRTFNKLSHGNIIKGSMINGYRIIRLKLYTAREDKLQNRLDHLQQQVFKLARKLKSLKENQADKISIKETELILESMKASLSKKFQDDLKARTVHQHFLIHRLVAAYFLPKPSSKQIIVGHLDYNKLNNRVNNLKWMTQEENNIHQQSSPYVIKDKKERVNRKENSKTAKLSVIKVMLLKKLLIEGKPVKQLSKQFRITETQVFRIKRGENWGDVKAAK